MITAKKKTKSDMEIDEFKRREKKTEENNSSKGEHITSRFESKELLQDTQNLKKKNKSKEKRYKDPEPYESSSERIYQMYQNPLHDADDIHIDTHTNRELHDAFDPFNREETIFDETKSLAEVQTELDNEYDSFNREDHEFDER